MIMQRVEEFEVNEAMIAKKPLGNWSCISCQKNLTNMNGQLSDYVVNNKMPERQSMKLP